MAYTALYRKFRPDNFDEVKGQDHIVTVLKNQIVSDRIGHAYLFCGTRGTGKTSVAKVLAKAVNCEHPVNGNPCNECAMCRSIKAGTSMNVIEIDAASNNGVENIRDIVEEVKYMPTEGRYRVYIIDEVHMLSVSAFNALLKTLEEPPSYVCFILATTEAHKIPVTIMSRCQRYDFKRIPNELITSHLEGLCKAEGIDADEKALRYIAGKADGAFRDAISLLDQCISFCFGEKLTYERVLEILGAVDIEIFARLLRYIRKSSVAECIEVLDSVVNNGRDMARFVVDFIWYMRNLLMLKTAENEIEIFDVSAGQLELLKNEAKVTEVSTLMRNITIFSELSNIVRQSTQKRILTELALIRSCMPQTETDTAALEERIRRLEDCLEKGIAFEKQEEGGEEENDLEEVFAEALPEDIKVFAASWGTLSKDSSLPQIVIPSFAGAVPSAEGNKLVIYLSDDMDMSICTEYKDDILKVFSGRLKKNYDIEFRVRKLAKKDRDKVDISMKVKGLSITYVD
jgi:DNA polymerase-3 subunit gamma/tau